MRIGNTPHKALLRILMRRDGRRNSGTVIDAACGRSLDRQMFHRMRYVGFDIDEVKLSEARRRLTPPDDRIYVCSIEEAPNILEERGHLVVCVQTIGTNQWCDVRHVHQQVLSLIALTRTGGDLIVNVGNRDNNIEQMSEITQSLLEERFATVKVVRHGATAKKTQSPKKRHLLTYYAIVLMMFAAPPLRTLFGRRHTKTYFYAQKKRS